MKVRKTVVATLIWAVAHIAFAYNGGYENSLDYKTNPGVGYGNYELTATPTLSSTVEANAYAQCKKLKSVNLSGVTSIGNAAFAYSALETVTIPATVKSMGYIAFGGCTNLMSATVSNFTWYNSSTEPFRDCTKLTTLTANCAPPSWDVKGVFANLKTVKCRSANVAAWKSKVPSATVSANTYTIRFNSNDDTLRTKSVAFDYDVATAVPKVSAIGWTRTGYVFAGWSLTESGVAKYGDGFTALRLAEAGKTLDLYAVWTLATGYGEIRYNANDGTAKKIAKAYKVGVIIQLEAIGGGLGFIRTGYVFKGWSESATNTTVKYANCAKVTNPAKSGKGFDLYAVWVPASGYGEVRYNSNDGTGKRIAKIYKAGAVIQLEPISSGLGFSRAGYVFRGWATDAKGTAATVKYANCAKVTNPAKSGKGFDLYAVWVPASGYGEVRYNSNDGTGKRIAKIYKAGAVIQLEPISSGLGFSRAGYVFRGWATDAKGTAATVKYANCAKVTNPAKSGKGFDLYAVWTKVATKTACANVLPATEIGTTNADYYNGTVDGYELSCFDLLLDCECVGYVRMTLGDEVLSGECEVLTVGDDTIVINLNDSRYVLSVR